MQQRALYLMASKLSAATVIEGNISEEGLAAMSDCEDMTTQLAKELVSGLKDNVEDLSESFRKMAMIGNRKSEKHSVVSISTEKSAKTKPNSVVISMTEPYITQIKESVGKTTDTGQLSILDLLAS